ncbi:MAG: PEP-CTERM sorting domain-containing protein, partial [Candidatus Methylacidiphilales bacterium]
DGEFSIRDITNATSSAAFSGTQNLMWVLNNSGSSLSYTNPSLSSTTLLDDRADLWLGTTKILDGVNIQTTTQTLSDLKFAFTAGSATITMDNFNITAIPEPSSMMLIGLGMGALYLVRRKRA